ncbi:MAG: hypothetical protein AAF141_03570 [Pseudomonadota bacterium]
MVHIFFFLKQKNTIGKMPMGNPIKFALIACTAMVVGLSSQVTSVSAQTFNSTVRSGVTSTVGTYWIFSKRGCIVGERPRARVTKQPKNSKITVQNYNFRIPKGQLCAGKAVPGVRFVYRSNRGFRGKDNGNISVVFSKFSDGAAVAKQSRGLRFNITVK